MTHRIARRSLLLLMACLAGMSTPNSMTAQLPVPSLSLMGGVSSFDLSGTGTTAIGAVRLSIPVGFLVAEGSLAAMRPDEQAVGRRRYIIPEAQLQYQFLPFLVKPYIGAGIGWFKAVSGPEPRSSDVTYSASAGVRMSVPLIPLGLRGEFRIRGIGSGFAGSATEYLLGVSF